MAPSDEHDFDNTAGRPDAGEPDAPAGDGGGPRANGAFEDDWRASIDDPRARTAAGKFADPGALAKSYHELEKKLGGAVTPPRPEADPAEWEAFYSRLGRPDSPEGYKLAPPEAPDGVALNEELTGIAGELFHRHGLSAAQAQGLFRDYVELELERYAEAGQADAAQAKETEALLRRRWSSAYEANTALANRAFKRYFGEAAETARQLKLADGTLLGNHPSVVEAFANIGRETAEDAFRTGTMRDRGHDTLNKRLTELRRKPDYEMTEADMAEKRHIYVELYGTAPADGRPG